MKITNAMSYFYIQIIKKLMKSETVMKMRKI